MFARQTRVGESLPSSPPASAEPSASVCHSTAASQQSDAEWIDDEQSLISGCVISYFVAAGARHATLERASAGVLRLQGQKDPRSLALHGILIFRSEWRVGQSVGSRGPLEGLLSLVIVSQHPFHSGFQLCLSFCETDVYCIA